MNWSDLKTVVSNVIKTNDANEITGANHQTTLHNVITQLGIIQFRGEAQPLTTPDIGDRVGWYLAKTDGTYNNFENNSIPLEIENELAIFSWDGTTWIKTVIMNTFNNIYITAERYNTDQDAANGDVPVNGFYVAGLIHERAPFGCLVQRVN